MPFEPYNPTQHEGFIPYSSEQDKQEGFIPAKTVGNTTIQTQGLFKRFGKQYYNVALAAPAFAMGTKSPMGIAKTDVKALRSLEEDVRSRYEKGQPLTQQEVEDYSQPYKKWSIGGLLGIDKPKWQQKLREDYQTGKVVIKEPETQEVKTKKLKAVLGAARIETAKKADISFAVSEAENWKEKGVDVVAGITGFVSQLTALKKAFPSAPPIFLWELQNQISGGTPGKGALTYGAFATPGKVIKGTTAAAKVGRLASESALVGGLSAIEQQIATGEINWKDVAVSAGIPVALRSLGYVKSRIAAKDTKVIKAAIEIQKKAVAKGAVPTIDSANRKLLETTATAKVLNTEEVKAAVKALRRRQAGRGTKATLAAIRSGRPVGEVIAAGRRAYKGKAKVPDITPPDLTPKEWDVYYKKILELYPPIGRKGTKTQFQRTGAKEALDKLRQGIIPTNYDFGFLDKLLGRETTLQLHQNLSQYRKFGLWDIPIEVRDGLKSMFGYDPQVVRQGRSAALRHPIIYAKGVVANLQGYVSKAQANKIQIRLETSPGWELSRKQGINYLGMTPWKSAKSGTRLQQYGLFTDFLLSRKNVFLKSWGKVLAASERGADVGINTMLKKMWDVGQQDLAAYQKRHPMTLTQIEKWNKARAHDINAIMKRVIAKNPKARDIQKAATWVLFSPAHTISRPIAAWRSIKNLATGRGISGRTYAAQLTVSNIASLSALSAIGAYVGHKARINDPSKEPTVDSSNDPTDSMWGKIRVGNDVIDLSGGDVGTYRLLARIGVSAYMYSKGKIEGKEYTYRPPGEEIKRYLTSRETVLLGLTKTLATGKDWLGEPIGRKEALLKQFPMEFLVSVVEAGNADGMWEAIQGGNVSKASRDLIKNIPIGVAGLAGMGTASYKVASASTRWDYQDIIAQKKYNKKWEDLNPTQQKLLRIQNKKQFQVFERKVAAERIEKPYDPTKIIEAQRKAGIRITQLLDKTNRSKIKGLKLSISRSPEKFRLNDDRYNRYQELIANYLNNLLTRVTIKEATRSNAETMRVQVYIELAKRRALIDLKREMR